MQIQPFDPTPYVGTPWYVLIIGWGLAGALLLGLISLILVWKFDDKKDRGTYTAIATAVICGLLFGGGFGTILSIQSGADLRNAQIAHYENEAHWASAVYGLPPELGLDYKIYRTNYQGRGAPPYWMDVGGTPGNLGYAMAKPGELIPVGFSITTGTDSADSEEVTDTQGGSYAVRYNEDGTLELFKIGGNGELEQLEPAVDRADVDPAFEAE